MKRKDLHSTTRFSNRARDYARYRPHYPAGIIRILRKEAGLRPDSVIADVGSGTGISAELFLKEGNTVHCVEPNKQMREAAGSSLKKFKRFISVDGTAERTTLRSGSVDYVIASQAFHWFDVDKSKAEFARILRPGGWVVIIWNIRRNSTRFLRGYEALLEKHGTDYHAVGERGRRRASRHDLGRLFAGRRYRTRILSYAQRLGYGALRGRLLSSSYVPASGDPRSKPMLADLKRLYRRYQRGGTVPMHYDTEIYFGRIDSDA